MELKMKVWIVSQDHGYEGLSQPEAVFSSEEAAEKYLEKQTGGKHWGISFNLETLTLDEEVE